MKVKFSIEFPIKASPHLLYQYISTSSGLAEWFADDVISRGQIYTFIWGDSEEKAKMVQKKQDEKTKFRWLDEDNQETENVFEFKIDLDELTFDVTLIITDMAEEDEVEDQKLLWQNQVNDLKKIIGSN